MAKNRIRWKKVMGNHYEGYVNGSAEYSFLIQGKLCLSDLRAMHKASTNWKPGMKHVSPNNYRIVDRDHGKQIAIDLLNGDNLKIHEKNRKDWLAEEERTAKLIQSTEKLLSELRKKDKIKP